MLKTKQNSFRDEKSLDGIWDFKTDPKNIGLNENWKDGFIADSSTVVPSSWNDLDPELSDYIGVSWYQTSFYTSNHWDLKNIFLRFDSVTYHSTIWINGTLVGKNEGGHLPFEFNVEKIIKKNLVNKLVVRVENELSPLRVPPGNVDTGSLSIFMNNIPSTNYDFFPYAGIDRSVKLYMLPELYISDIDVNTSIEKNTGRVTVEVKSNSKVALEAFAELSEGNSSYKSEQNNINNKLVINVDNPKLWSPANPSLYNLNIQLLKDGNTIDSYDLDIGIREIQAKNGQIYLNGEKIELKGFGRHEDSPVTGRGKNLPQTIKDHNLLKWIGANSYRTAHYPYSEEDLELADRNGFLVVDEIPAVGLFFDDEEKNIETRLNLCKSQLKKLISRDKNHPSVIMWSVANEPFPPDLQNRMKSGNNEEVDNPISTNFLNSLIKDAKKQDNSRLVSFAGIHGTPLEWFQNVDVIMINRYYGWYFDPLNLDEAMKKLSNELEDIYGKTKKPIIISEFGSDTIPGFHSASDELYTEEYQVEYWKKYLELAEQKDYLVGLHAWVFADFRTTHSTMRIGGLNHKGAFTRDRKPKMSAHFLKSKWKN
ncbi:MAG: beta-glucuronidase [Chloroflexota bacterium]|nr:beta-glucuronidase [Chloroflexota bacterium]